MKSVPVGTRIKRGHLTGTVVSKPAKASGVQMIQWDDVPGLWGFEWWPSELIWSHVAQEEVQG